MRKKAPAMAERILHAASQLFARQHFHEVRMEDIAVAAAVGKGTLYRYFSDKDELYLALLERASGQFMCRILDAMGQDTEPRARLHRAITALLAYFDEQPHIFDLIQRAEVLRGPGFPWRATREKLIRLMTELFEQLHERNEFTTSDPELAALLLLGGLRSVIRFGKTPRPPDWPQQMVDTFVRSRQPASRSYRAQPLPTDTVTVPS
jgi:AcrR family transcriptional regulator